MTNEKRATINYGGSNRKLQKQMNALYAASVDFQGGSTRGLGMHHSNHSGSILDTPENRLKAKAIGCTFPRK